MRKFLLWRRFSAYTAYTGAANASTLPHLLRRKCRSTAASLFFLIRCVCSLKNTYLECVRRSSVSTSPNFAQENDISRGAYFMDEYDRFDYEQWEANREDEWNDIGWPDWAVEAVDEAIAEEKPGEYPPGVIGDIPF